MKEKQTINITVLITRLCYQLIKGFETLGSFHDAKNIQRVDQDFVEGTFF